MNPLIARSITKRHIHNPIQLCRLHFTLFILDHFYYILISRRSNRNKHLPRCFKLFHQLWRHSLIVRVPQITRLYRSGSTNMDRIIWSYLLVLQRGGWVTFFGVSLSSVAGNDDQLTRVDEFLIFWIFE